MTQQQSGELKNAEHCSLSSSGSSHLWTKIVQQDWYCSTAKQWQKSKKLLQ